MFCSFQIKGNDFLEEIKAEKLQLLNTYRKLSCLNNSYYNAFGICLVFGTFYGCIAHVTCNYYLIKKGSTIGEYGLLLLLVNYMLFQFVNVYSQSAGTIVERCKGIKWRLNTTTLVSSRKRSAACRIITTNIGPYVRIGLDSKIRYCSWHSRNLIDALVVY